MTPEKIEKQIKLYADKKDKLQFRKEIFVEKIDQEISEVSDKIDNLEKLKKKVIAHQKKNEEFEQEFMSVIGSATANKESE